MSAILLLLFCQAAWAVEPSGWERKNMDGAPVSILVPTGSQPQQTGQRHPGFDETTSGWQLQSHSWPGRGASRMILYLQRGDITIYYSRNAPQSKYRTLDDYLESEMNGRKPEAEQYGKWKGYTVRLLALKDPDRHPSVEAPFGDLAIHAVEFGPNEYLAITLHANPDAVQGYLPYLYKVRDSIRYSKAILVAKRPPRSEKTAGRVETYQPEPAAAPAPPARLSTPMQQRLVLLPHLGIGGPFGRYARTGRNYYPYVRVLQCPQGFLPVPSSWPRIGAFVCRPIRPYSGQ